MMVLMVLLFLLLWLLLCADDGVRAYVDDGDGGDGEMMVCVRMRWCCPQKECSSFCVASAGEGKSCRRDKGGGGAGDLQGRDETGERRLGRRLGRSETCKGGRRPQSTRRMMRISKGGTGGGSRNGNALPPAGTRQAAGGPPGGGGGT